MLDADISRFLDTVSHDWLIRFLERRIGDKRAIRLIEKWLKAGCMEEGAARPSEEGAPQGAVVSPLLADICLHYVFDLWARQWRARHAYGNMMILIRHADDIVVGFEKAFDAKRFLAALRERMEQFSLSLHPEKTRLLEFGRFAAVNRAKRGEGKPETFTFLGFTHACGQSPLCGGPAGTGCWRGYGRSRTNCDSECASRFQNWGNGCVKWSGDTTLIMRRIPTASG